MIKILGTFAAFILIFGRVVGLTTDQVKLVCLVIAGIAIISSVVIKNRIRAERRRAELLKKAQQQQKQRQQQKSNKQQQQRRAG